MLRILWYFDIETDVDAQGVAVSIICLFVLKARQDDGGRQAYFESAEHAAAEHLFCYIITATLDTSFFLNSGHPGKTGNSWMSGNVSILCV